MNTVRWHLLDTLRKRYPDIEIRNTYGAETSAIRKDRHIIKSHANDACVMGDFHPKHRVRTRHWKKQRRNDRRLQRFYDAKYIDSRDGTVKTGKQLSSGRTSRSRWDGENLHLCREKKVSKGHINIRRSRTSLKPGSVVEFEGKRLIVKGVHRQKSNSCNVEFVHPAAGGRKSASLKKLTVIKTQYTESWKEEV
ncbi:MAG: hypothetical protein LUG21_08615 [Clostridiales bacterium]|nr:hypothetical protein [Clostridiales bacterium]